MSIEKKINNWFNNKPKNPKVYLLIGIIFFATQALLSGLEGVSYLEKKSMSRFIILLIPGLIGIVGLIKYFNSVKKID